MFFIYSLFFLTIVVGFIASSLFELVRHRRVRRFIITSLIFDLFILIINLVGLYICKGIYTVETLMVYFNCLSFTVKYALLSILIGIILAIIAGLVFRLCHKRKFFHCREED